MQILLNSCVEFFSILTNFNAKYSDQRKCEQNQDLPNFLHLIFLCLNDIHSRIFLI